LCAVQYIDPLLTFGTLQTRSTSPLYSLLRLRKNSVPINTEQKQIRNAPICPLCGKPCPSEDAVTDAEGRAVHKSCYRSALIGGQGHL